MSYLFLCHPAEWKSPRPRQGSSAHDLHLHGVAKHGYSYIDPPAIKSRIDDEQTADSGGL